MKLSLAFKDYVAALSAAANAPLEAALLVGPFGLKASSPRSRTLLVGHLLDALAESYREADAVDCLDVALVAWELGFEAGARLLDDLPECIEAALSRACLH